MSAGVRIKDKTLLTATPEAIKQVFAGEGVIVSSAKLTARALVIVTSFTPECSGKKLCGPYRVDLRVSDDDVSVRFGGLSPRDYGHLNTYHAQEMEVFKGNMVSVWGTYRKLAEEKVED